MAFRATVIVFAVLTAYGIFTARETCGDLHYAWAPKAVRFFRAGAIDFAYLTDPVRVSFTPDYPPLLPLLFAWANSMAHQFPWWAAVASGGLFVFAGVLFARGASGDDHGAALMAAALAYTTGVSFSPGGADPPLLMFEIVALAALTFLDGKRGSDVLVAIALAGAVWTKVEGATFAIAVVLSMIVVRRTIVRALLVATPAALLLGAWLVAMRSHNLLRHYAHAEGEIHWEVLPKALITVAREASYDLYGLPWLIPLVLIAFGNVRRAAFPVAIAILTAGATVYFYVHAADPTFWIESSAMRVLQTPLAALLVGAMAARPYARVPAHGVVSQGEETEGSGRAPGVLPGGAVGQV